MKLHLSQYTGPWFNIKMPSYQYRKSHCGDKTVVRSSYLHNGISYTGKMVSFYWISPLEWTVNHIYWICKVHKNVIKDQFVSESSQWEMTLHCNAVYHWLGAYTNDPCVMIISNNVWNMCPISSSKLALMSLQESCIHDSFDVFGSDENCQFGAYKCFH